MAEREERMGRDVSEMMLAGIMGFILIEVLLFISLVINWTINFLLTVYQAGSLFEDGFFCGYVVLLVTGTFVGYLMITWCFDRAREYFHFVLKWWHYFVTIFSWTLFLLVFMMDYFFQFMTLSMTYNGIENALLLIVGFLSLASVMAWITFNEDQKMEKQVNTQSEEELIAHVGNLIDQHERERRETVIAIQEGIIREVLHAHDNRAVKMQDSEEINEIYVINAHLQLQLINDQTVIYVDGKEFMQCKYLLLNLDLTDLEEYDEITSIDEAAERLNHSHENDSSLLTPKEEFRGHCSNLQAWYEHEYDPRLLHSNLALPLLAKLSDGGDHQALIVLKEEIAKRLELKSMARIILLIEGGFLKYLSKAEINALNLTQFEKDLLKYIKNK